MAVVEKFRRAFQKLRHLRVHDERTAYTLQEISTLKKVISAGAVDCVFDIGANMGQYGKMLRKKVGYPGLIISVEPNPATFRYLQQESQPEQKWLSYNLGLGAQDGEQLLSIMKAHQFTSFSEPITAEAPQLATLNSVVDRVAVPVKTLESFLLETQGRFQFQRPFLKLDTQGYDAIIVKSAGKTISQFVGIQTEISFARLYADSLSFSETVAFCRDLGFTLAAMFPNNAGHFPHLIEQDAIFLNQRFFGEA
jgi:FkbM family methyltransferase